MTAKISPPKTYVWQQTYGRVLGLSIALMLTVPLTATWAQCNPSCTPCGEIFNVLDYGADGTDIYTPTNMAAEDTCEIQAALTCAAACATSSPNSEAYGGTVLIPPGVFYVKELRIDSNVALIGEGMGKSILRMIDHCDSGAILRNAHYVAGDSHIKVSGITFDGDWDASDDTSCDVTDEDKLPAQVGLSFVQVKDFIISDSEFMNARKSGVVTQQGLQRGLIEGCYAHNNGGQGFYAQRWVEQPIYADQDGILAEELRYVGCHAENNRLHGFDLYEVEGVTYVGCTAVDNTRSGFHIDAARRVTYESCIAKENGHNGFIAYGVQGALRVGDEAADVTYSASIAENNTENGFWLKAPDPLNGGATQTERDAVRFAVQGCHATGNYQSGIRISRTPSSTVGSKARYFTIQGGTVVSNGEHGIYIRNGGYGTVSSVVIKNNGTMASDKDGIYIETINSGSTSSHIAITGNTISDDQTTKTQQYAVQSIGSDYVVVLGNNVDGNAQSSPISLSGGNNEIAHNIGDSTPHVP